jgi:hypothetical protein
MLINILLIILGIFLSLALESFFVSLISFSIVIILALEFVNKWDWKKWSIILFIITFLLDIVTHRALGITLLAISLSTILLYLLFLLVPKKKIILSYLPYLLATILFYIVIIVFSPLLQDGVWGVLNWNILISVFLKSTISSILIFTLDIAMDRFRTDGGISI